MAVRVYQRSFNGGEVSPSMYARIDDGKYQTGLAKCTNFLVEPQGPITMRPGFAYVNKTKQQDKPARLIPFTFSTDQTMVLEFGDKYVRFHTQGQTLMGSNGQPYEVVTPYSIDDVFDIHYVQSADVLTLVHPLYAPRELRRYGATDWRLEEINFGATVESPEISDVTFSATSGDSTEQNRYTYKYVVTSIKEVDGEIQESAASDYESTTGNLYLDNAYCKIKWSVVPGADRYRVYRSNRGLYSYIGETDEVEFTDDNYEPDTSITPPIYGTLFMLDGGITSVQVTNQGSGYAPEGRVEKVADFIYFMVDGKMGAYKFKIDIDDTDAAGTGGFPDFEVVDLDGEGRGCTVKMDGYASYGHDHADRNGTFITGFTILTSGTGYVTPRINLYKKGTKELVGYVNLSISQDGYDGVRLTVSDSTGTGAQLKAIVSDGKVVSVSVINGGSGYTNPTITARAYRGSGATFKATLGKGGDYPGAVCYFEQRRWFGGTYMRPNNLWATKSGTESDMSYSLPSQDDDRISVRVAAREANRIRHMVPLSHLILLTGASEWRVSPLNSDAITPSSMSVRPQSYVGANNVQPLVVSSTMIYAAERGGHLRECGYSYEAGGYVSNDVCLRAPHLFDNHNIIDMAYSKAPWPIAWSVNDNGDLIALTYVPEQQVGAFSTIQTDNGYFHSCCVVAEGDEDILYCVIERVIAGVKGYYVERMTERQFSTLEQCNYLDCSGSYIGEAKTEISGLTWLEGMEVSIVADGSVENSQVVKNGKITLSMPANIVHVGLAYSADAQTLPVALSMQDGSFGSTHQKNVRAVSLRVIDSSGIKAGSTFDTLREYPSRSTESAGSPPNPVTDEIDIPITGKWDKSGQVCIRQDYPLPMKIVSITTTVEIS